MSKTIDQKVVEMRFDNAQFEKGIAQSTNSLNKFKSALDFDGLSSSGLKSIQNGFSQLEVSISGTANGFTALEEIAIGALRSIGSGIVTLAEKYVSGLLNNLKAGYGRYEEMMKSTQTIMYALRDQWDDQGAEMEYVNAQLERLNWYTDETSYNLTDMTNNIGKFVAAGIPLEDAVSDMMGIASWAALSGQNAEAASRAMYNLSQAMGMGKLTTVDWRSIENANMATREFKNVAIETGLALGTLYGDIDDYVYAIDQYGHEIAVTSDTFRNTLAAGWLDKDVLSATLQKYGDFAVKLGEYAEQTGIETTKLLEYLDIADEGKIFDWDLEDNEAELNAWFDNFFKENKIALDQQDSLREMMYNLSGSYYDLGKAAFKAGQESKTFSDSLGYTKDAVSTAYMNIFQKIFGNYLESKELWTNVSEWMYSLLVQPVQELGEKFENLYNIGGFDKLKDALTNIVETIIRVKEAIGEGFDKVFKDDGAKSLFFMLDKVLEITEKIKLDDKYFEFDKVALAAESVARVFNRLLISIGNIKNAIAGAWEKIFPKKDSHRGITSMANAIRDAAAWIEKLSEKFVINEERSKKLERAFAGLFAILDIVRQLFVAIISPFRDLETETGNLGDNILEGAASIGDWLVSVRDWLAENQIFQKAVDKLVEIWGNIKPYVVMAWEAVKDFFTHLPEYAEQASQKLFGLSLEELWEKIKGAALDAWEALKKFFGWLLGMFSKTGEDGEETSEEIAEGLTEGFTEEKTKPITEFMESITGKLDELKSTWQEVKPYVDEFFNMFKENIEWPDFDELAEGGKKLSVIAILAGIAAIIWNFVRALTKLDKEKSMIVNSIKYMFTSIGDAAKALKKNIQAQTFKTIATALLEVAAAIFILALLPQDKMLEAAAVIVFVMGELGLVFAMITGISASEKRLDAMKKVMLSLELLLATMIGGIIAIALTTDIASAESAAIMIGGLIAVVAGLLTVIAKMQGNASNIKKLVPVIDSVAILIGAMGASLMLATAFGNPMSIAAAGLSMSLMLGEIIWFFQQLNNSEMKSMTKAKVDKLVKVMTSVSILIGAMGTALFIATMGGADWKALGMAGASMAGMLISLAFALRLMPDKKNMDEMAVSLITASVAMMMMGNALALATMGGADWKSLGMAGAVMAGMILALALAFKIMPDSGKMIKAAAGLAVASASLILIAGALAILSQLNLSQVGISLLALAGAIVVVLAAGLAANFIGGGLLILGAAIALIGAGAMMAGAGLWLVAEAMQTLFSLDPEGVNTIMLALQAFFTMLPFFLQQVAVGILAFLEVFVNAREAIKEMFVGTFTTILEAYLEVMPKVVQAVVETITQILGAYRTIMPQVVAAVTETLIAILDSLITVLPKVFEFLTALFYEIVAFTIETAPTFVETVFFVLQLLFDKLVEFTYANLPKLVDLITFVVTELCRSIAETTAVIVATLIAMLIDVLEQVLANIGTIVALSVEIAIEIIVGLLDGLAEGIPRLANAGIDCLLAIINGIADGLEERADDIRDTMYNVAQSLINAFKTVLGIDSPSTVFSGFGENIMQGLIDGINSLLSKAKETITDVATSVSDWFKDVLQIESPSKVFKKYGKYIDEGLSRGISDNSWLARIATEEMGEDTINSMSNVLSGLNDVIEDGMDTQPTIRPVLDLTNVEEGISTMDSMFENSQTMSMAQNSGADANGQVSRYTPWAEVAQGFKDYVARNRSEKFKAWANQNNTFNITGDDPKAIANEVSFILQKQVERKDAVWE